jgi:hypothetical protein
MRIDDWSDFAILDPVAVNLAVKTPNPQVS